MKNKTKFFVGLLAGALTFGVGYLSNASQIVDSAKLNINISDATDTQIRNYYANANNKKGTDLLAALKTITSTNHQAYEYDDVWDIYKITDRNWELSPLTSSQLSSYNPSTDNPYIHLLYRTDNDNAGTAAHANDTHGKFIDREHIWPKSLGNFDINAPAGTDLHHLWPGDHVNNSSAHNNDGYGYVTKDKEVYGTASTHNDTSFRGKTTYGGKDYTVFEPQDCDKGDIARACFYMAARYSSYTSSSDPYLTLTNDYSKHVAVTSSETVPGCLASLETLLEWNKLDPVDEFEIHRNNLVYNNYQHNRNPFIDFPQWADIAYGTGNETTNVSTDWVNDVDPSIDQSILDFQKEKTFASLKISYLPEQTNEIAGYWQLATSTSKLVAGKTYTIANTSNGDGVAAATTVFTNSRESTPVSVENSKIQDNLNILRLTLEGSEGAWTFKTQNYLGTNGYLAGGASTNNYLKINSTTSSDLTKFTISFDNGVMKAYCNGANTKYIQYNQSGNRFACYATNQKPVYLYEFVQTGYLSSYYPTKTGEDNDLSMSFGTWYKASLKQSLINLGVTEFGIAYKKGNASTYTYKAMQGAFVSEALSSTAINETLETAVTNNHYTQSVLTFDKIPTTDFKTEIRATGYVKIGTNYYYTRDKHYSVKSICADYLGRTPNDPAVVANKSMLEWFAAYEG